MALAPLVMLHVGKPCGTAFFSKPGMFWSKSGAENSAADALTRKTCRHRPVAGLIAKMITSRMVPVLRIGWHESVGPRDQANINTLNR